MNANTNHNADSDTAKKLTSDFKINFENINKINMTIAAELEKRFSFAEESAKILLNQNIDFSVLSNLTGTEKSKINFANIKKYIIDENASLCGHIFESINFSSMFLAYLTYISENRTIIENYKNILEKSGLAEIEEVNISVKLNEKFSLNSFLQYISLFDFKISLFYYDGIKNSADISIEIKDKINIFAVFMDLLKYYGVSEISINL